MNLEFSAIDRSVVAKNVETGKTEQFLEAESQAAAKVVADWLNRVRHTCEYEEIRHMDQLTGVHAYD